MKKIYIFFYFLSSSIFEIKKLEIRKCCLFFWLAIFHFLNITFFDSRVTSSVKSISVTGSTASTQMNVKEKCSENQCLNKPVLIEPEVKDQVFIDLSYELNPLNSSYNKRLRLKSRSLKIIYHAITINNIAYFFRSSELTQQKKWVLFRIFIILLEICLIFDAT